MKIKLTIHQRLLISSSLSSVGGARKDERRIKAYGLLQRIEVDENERKENIVISGNGALIKPGIKEVELDRDDVHMICSRLSEHEGFLVAEEGELLRLEKLLDESLAQTAVSVEIVDGEPEE